MVEFTRSVGLGKSLRLAVENIFSLTNPVIAVVLGVLGYVGFEYLCKQLWRNAHTEFSRNVRGAVW